MLNLPFDKSKDEYSFVMERGRRVSKSERLQLLRLPDELLIEILSWLPVKSLLQFRLVSKTWKSFISDSQFVKLHLHRSISRTPDFAHTRLLIKCLTDDLDQPYISSRTVSSSLKSHSATVGSQSFLSGYDFIGTCNGLISLKKIEYDKSKRKYFSLLRFWNPATRTMSQHSPPTYSPGYRYLGFGYDCSSDTYKVVRVNPQVTMVNVYNMGDNCWRTIQVSPLAPMFPQGPAVYVNNTLNWLATLPCDVIFPIDVTMDSDNLMDTDPYFIVSFDLGKEEHPQQLSLPYCPRRRKEYIDFEPILGVLRGCLCISQNSRDTRNFVLWQMKEFGVHQSWTLLFNINIDEKILHLPCFVVCMSENGDALLFARFGVSQAVIYNQRDNKLEDTKISNDIVGFYVKNYIESLVSPS